MSFANRARAYDPDADEVLNRDLFVTLLESMVTRRGGTYRGVAARAGYSRRYLTYVRTKQRPVPSPEAVERIIEALPHATEREARHLREFARRAAAGRQVRAGSVRLVLDPAEAEAALRQLLDDYHRALHPEGADPAATRLLGVRSGTTRALALVRNLLADPATSAHLSILLCNVLNVVYDPAGALRAARVAQVVLEEHAARTGARAPHLNALWVEAVRAEAMTLHNLRLDRRALDRYQHAERMLASRPSDPQRTYVALGRVSAAVETRRFRIGDVKGWVDDVYRDCDRGLFSDPETNLLLFQARRGLASAYVRHGDLKPRTGRLLRDELERMERVELAGPIHRVQLYRTCAEFCAARTDAGGWRHYVALGMETAKAAGLDHQARRLEEELSIPAASGARRAAGI